MKLKKYNDQLKCWPQTGKHVMAQFDDESVIVYQAYRPEIAEYAVEHQKFGGAFSFSRMSWIKPNFLWMMYRSGWATKVGQERILAVTLNRSFFDELTEEAVASSFGASVISDPAIWSKSVANSDVRLQWDPDHSPTGEKVERRAVQLGLRGETLKRYAQDEVIKIEDITVIVEQQRVHAVAPFIDLTTPLEYVYPLTERGRENLRAE